MISFAEVAWLLLAAFAVWLIARNFGMRGAGAPHVTGDQARALVGEGATLVDVRMPFEFASDHIAGAINIPAHQIVKDPAAVPAGRPVVLYCRSGARSARAGRALMKAGRTDVYDLGPRIRWR